MRTLFDDLIGLVVTPAVISAGNTSTAWTFIGDWLEVTGLVHWYNPGGAGNIIAQLESATDSAGTGPVIAAVITAASSETAESLAVSINTDLLAAGHKYMRLYIEETTGLANVVATGLLVGIPRYAEHRGMV